MEEEETPSPTGDLVRFRDVGSLMAALVEGLKMLYPDARRAIEACTAGRCEGAYFQTIAKAEKGELRKPPIAWFRSTLKRRLEWTPEEIALHFAAQRELELKKMERSNDVTMKRLAKQEREAADGLVNVNQARAKRRAVAASDVAASTGPPAASETIPSVGQSSSGRSP